MKRVFSHMASKLISKIERKKYNIIIHGLDNISREKEKVGFDHVGDTSCPTREGINLSVTIK